MTNTLNTPIEALERAFPVIIREYALSPQKHAPVDVRQGGRGVVRHYQFLVDTMVTVMGERRRWPPTGLHGAPSGETGVDEWSPDGKNWIPLPSKASIEIKAGGHLRIRTPSGGSWRGQND